MWVGLDLYGFTWSGLIWVWFDRVDLGMWVWVDRVDG